MEKVVTNFTRVFGGAVPSIPTKPKPAGGLSQKQAPSDLNKMVTAAGTTHPGAPTRVKPAATNMPEATTPIKAPTATVTTVKTVSRSSQSVQTKKTALNSPVHESKGSVPRIALPPKQSSISQPRTLPRKPSVQPNGVPTSGEATHTMEKVVTNFTRVFGGAVPSIPAKPKPAGALSQKQAPSDLNRLVTAAGTAQPGAPTRVKPAATNMPEATTPIKAPTATVTTVKTVSRSSQSVQTKKTALNSPVHESKGSLPRIALPPKQSSISQPRTLPRKPSVQPNGVPTSGEATHTMEKVVTNFTRVFGGAVPAIPTKPKPAGGLSQKQAPSDLNRMVTAAGTTHPGAPTRVKPAATNTPEATTPIKAPTATVTTVKTASKSSRSVQTKKTALNSPVHESKGSVPRRALPPKQSSIPHPSTLPRKSSVQPNGVATSGEATHTTEKVVTNFTRMFGGAVPSIPTKPKPAGALSQKQAPSDLNRLVTAAGTAQPGAPTRVKPAATNMPEATTPIKAPTATVTTVKTVSRSSLSVQTKKTALNSPVHESKGSLPRIALPPKQSSISQPRTLPRKPSVQPNGVPTSGEATHTMEKVVTNFTRVFGGAVPAIPTKPKPAGGLSQKQAPSDLNRMVTAAGTTHPGAPTRVKPAATNTPEATTPIKAPTATVTTVKTVSRSSQSVQTKKTALNSPVHESKGSGPRIALPPKQSSISQPRTLPRKSSVRPNGVATSGEATHTTEKVVTNFTRVFGGAVPSIPANPKPAGGLSQKQAPSDLNRMVTAAGTTHPGAPTRVKPAATNMPEATTPIKAPTATVTTVKTVSRSSQSVQTKKTALNSPVHESKGSGPRIALPPKQSSISQPRTLPRKSSVRPNGVATSGEATRTTEKVVTNFTRVFGGAVPSIPTNSKPAGGLSQKQAPSDLNRMVTAAGTTQPGAHTRVKPAAKSVSQAISGTRSSVLKVRPTTLMTINATTASHVTLNQVWPQHDGVSQLLLTTSTMENKTIGIPLAPGIIKPSISVSATQRDATVSNNAFPSALTQMLLLRILGRVDVTSPSAVIWKELLPSFTGEPAVASKPIARETVPKATFVKGHKCDQEALANARAVLSGLQPILEREKTTTTIATFLKAPGGRIFNVTDVVSSSTTIQPISRMSAATIHNESPAMPSYFKNVHKAMTETQQRVTGQASQLEPSLSEMQTKGQPCRLQPPVTPVLSCRFTCDNHKDNERYEIEKDGTPCHLHRRVRSLIGVCVRGQCQQIANK
nr:proteoglycan 4-like [Dermacentor andersoni]